MIEVTWADSDQRVVRMTVHPGWTWDDATEALDACYEMIREKQYRVLIVADTQLAPNPPNNEVLGAFRYAWTNLPDNADTFVTIGMNFFLEQMSNMFNRTFLRGYPKGFFVRTEEEAQRIIEARLKELDES